MTIDSQFHNNFACYIDFDFSYYDWDSVEPRCCSDGGVVSLFAHQKTSSASANAMAATLSQQLVAKLLCAVCDAFRSRRNHHGSSSNGLSIGLKNSSSNVTDVSAEHQSRSSLDACEGAECDCGSGYSAACLYHKTPFFPILLEGAHLVFSCPRDFSTYFGLKSVWVEKSLTAYIQNLPR